MLPESAETDSDVGTLSVSESESGSNASGSGVAQVSPRVLLLVRLRTPQRSDLTRNHAIRRNMSVAQRGSVHKKRP